MILKKYNLFFTILLTYLFSRFLILKLGIFPNSEILPSMWQIMDLSLLENNFLSSLYYLHYQPPIWNFLIGIIVKIYGPDYLIISKVIYIFNIFISTISIYIFYKLSLFLEFNKRTILVASLFYIIFSLSYIFYENYLHYTHLTTLFFLLLIFNYYKFSRNFEYRFEIYIYTIATLLVYTWSAFSHPFFILLIFLTIILNKYKIKILRSLITFLFFFIIAILPSIKNKIELNLFANSSWIGLQVIQVLKRWDVENGLCNMNFTRINQYENDYINKYNFSNNHPSLTGDLSKWNNVGMIYKTQKCLKIGLNLIFDDPINYFSIVKFNFISTHGHFAFDHGFKPIKWNYYFDFFDDLKKNKVMNIIKVRVVQLYYVLVYLFFFLLLIRSLFKINQPNSLSNSKVASSIFLIYLWMIILTHMFAGFEQERMRHIGHFMHVLFFSFLIKNKFNFFKLANFKE